jgi:hypothetical protein
MLAPRAYSRYCHVVAKTHPLEDVVKTMPAPSERWLLERLRKGQIPGRKIGRHWYMTDQDIIDTLDILKNDPHVSGAPTGLTPRSQKRGAK